MSDKKISVGHVIRNITEGKNISSDEPKISVEHTIRNIHEGIGIIGSEKPAKTSNTHLTIHYSSQGSKQSTKNVQAGKVNVARQAQQDPIKMEDSDMSGASGGTYPESGKKKVKENAPSDMSGVTAQWSSAESGKKKIKEVSMSTMGGQGNEVGDMGRNFKTEDGKKMKEESSYHVSWGPGLDHEVVAANGDEAVSKAKEHLKIGRAHV